MRAVGMAGKKAGRQTKPAEQQLQADTAGRTRHCRQTQPADSPPGTGLKETNGPQLAGLAAKTTAAGDVGLPLAVQCR